MVSIGLSEEHMGDREDYPSVAYGAGIPPSVTEMTIAVPFNDADALERRIDRLAAEGRLPACLIMEAALMNCGVILPEPGYLDRVREITRRHGIVWIVDEVKTGLTIAPGGACEYFGIQPDIVCLAKALGGGLPSAAIGATHEMMEPVLSGRVCMVGTYNGNPLVMAATRANLLDVMTPDAYARLEQLNTRLLDGTQGVIDAYGIAAYPVGIRSKGVVAFSDSKLVDYETFKRAQDEQLMALAWLWNMNRGIFATPGREEEWTLSIAMSDADVDHYVDIVRRADRGAHALAHRGTRWAGVRRGRRAGPSVRPRGADEGGDPMGRTHDAFAKPKYLALTTFRKDGRAVSTPVWFAHDGDRLVVVTGTRRRGRRSGSGTARRVLVAPCDMRGRPKGEAVEAIGGPPGSRRDRGDPPRRSGSATASRPDSCSEAPARRTTRWASRSPSARTRRRTDRLGVAGGDAGLVMRPGLGRTLATLAV